ncbi:MAG TPA: SAM-dependent methyltransferase [Deltaproteobacteria bacterium]|nr:SAM-dependent methyltransferase [Deltaproteobacteria bacterium]
MNPKDHWEKVYSKVPADKMGWYEPHLRLSLNWIQGLGLVKDAPIIDVGGGSSTLVDDLLDAGFSAITVLDISEKALMSAQARLGARSKGVTWLYGDIATIELPRERYELWHDRAMFHFLLAEEQQEKYLQQLERGLTPNGHLIIGAFAPEAPPQCSGLSVRRYDTVDIESTLGPTFELKRCRKDLHVTPGGVEQMYLYCHFMKVG